MSNNPTSQQHSFLSLIKEYSIEIPIIQRDYAQGRSDRKTAEIRATFLDTIIKTLIEGSTLELDFVYGDTSDGVFRPLDGQQRLTTLFLLHWYLANKESRIEEAKSLLGKFSYETRTSSSDFCKALVTSSVDISSLTTNEHSLSAWIEDQAWFFLSWKNDPTIQSMLVMLDAIHRQFSEKAENAIEILPLFDRLSNITFHFIPLEDFGLSDDLYIKMNARGKPLTEFENFKAKFEQYIKEKKFESEEAKLKDKFAYKLDTTWTDFFWDQRNTETNRIDEQVIQFFATTAIISYAEDSQIEITKEEKLAIVEKLKSSNKGKEPTEEAVNREAIEKRVQDLHVNNNLLRPNDFLSAHRFNYLKQLLDVYSSIDQNSLDEINKSLLQYKLLPARKGEKEDTYSYLDIALFYAQSCYLLKSSGNELEESRYKDWMRVVRNITWQLQQSASQLISVISLIQELSKGCLEIHHYLANNEIESRFASEQVAEEVRKAKLIVANEALKMPLHVLEDTSFCKGTINWCIECALVDQVSQDIDSDKLKSIKYLIDELLDSNEISNLFRRAMFTIGDKRFYYYKHGKNSLTNSIKRAIIEDRVDLKSKFTKGNLFEMYFKPLINALLDCSLDKYDDRLQELIKNYDRTNVPSWKKRIIDHTTLLDSYCQKHYMGIRGEDEMCFLFKNKIDPRNLRDCVYVKNLDSEETIIVDCEQV